MSSGAKAGIFLKLSRLLVRIDRWVMVQMSMNRKRSGSNGSLPASSRARKHRENLHGSDSVKKWKGKFFLFSLFGVVTAVYFWFLLSSSEKGLVGSCEEKAQFLLSHFNVSKSEFLNLASLFSESEQILSIKCTKEPQAKMPPTDEIVCAMKVFCSKRDECCENGGWVAEDGEPNGQCRVQDQSLHEELMSFLSQSTVPSIPQNCEKSILGTKEVRDCGKGRIKIFSFSLVERFWWVLIGMIASGAMTCFYFSFRKKQQPKLVPVEPAPQQRQFLLQLKQHQLSQIDSPPKGAGKWRKKLLKMFVILGVLTSICLFFHFNAQDKLMRAETLTNMCEERARMLQDQFNVSMNHVQALAILVSSFHHSKNPSAIDQKTFGEYTERTAFERPLTSGVAYALKVLHSERKQFEKQHGWAIRKMETSNQTPVQDCVPDKLDPAPIQDEYAPVIFAQETVSHIISIDMMSGEHDRENILRARATGKGVLTSPFKLLKSNHLGVVLTYAVYNAKLPPDATPEQRIEAAVGYIGASYDVPSLVEKLLNQLASKQTIVVNVYDTTNASAPIVMYGGDAVDTGLLRIRSLEFGDPLRKHEMHCRYKQKPPLPWTAMISAMGALVITLLLGHIFHAAIRRIAKVEEDYHKMMELKVRAEAADVAKSQFLATVSHEIRTPMNGVLGMLQMLMDTDLNATQLDYAETAHNSGRELISLINEVLDQAKIESGRLELEEVPFDLRSVLDNVLSQFLGRSNEKGIELACYVSNEVPEVVLGDPGRFRQIITNLVGNSVKFTEDKGHIFVSVHLADEVGNSLTDAKDTVLKQAWSLVQEKPHTMYDTLSGFPVVDRWKSWEKFKSLKAMGVMADSELIRLLITVEDTGVGIPLDAQSRIFTPFVQADSSTSRTYGGTGIGLSISKCLVDLMGGEIGFVSDPGIGSTFSFTATLRKGESSSLDSKWQPSDPSVLEFRRQRALVIDNRSIRAEVTRYHLQRLGIFVETASSLRSACSHLSSYSSTQADLSMILIDKDVWDRESCFTLHRLLKELEHNDETVTQANLPKIFLQATIIGADVRSELKSSGLVDDVIMKPLRLGVLIACLQEAFGSGKRTQVNRKPPPTLCNLLRDKRILVVDDNMVNRRVAEGALKKYGAIVTCVDSGRAAIDMLTPPHKFDACFMDRQMPEMDGFEATRRIRSMESEVNERITSGRASMEMYGNIAHWHTPILAMTADVMQATNEVCMRCGMDGYVSKPFEEEQLYNAVARFFESE